MSRNGEFSINIGLVEDGVPVLGVVAAPALSELYWASVGQGARQKLVACSLKPVITSRHTEWPAIVIIQKLKRNSISWRGILLG